MEKKVYTVAVDLGSSNVVVAVASRVGESGPLHIEALVSRPVEGVSAGRIENIELVAKALAEAKTEAEQTAGMHIAEAWAGISGEFVRCARHTDHVFTGDPVGGVGQGDMDALYERMRNVQAPDDETIMERIPQLYLVDDRQEVRNPVGSFGKRLSSTFNFILCAKTPIQRLEMALKRVGVRTLGVFPNPLATPEAVLSHEEREEGVAVVDIGGGVTDVAVYYRGVPRYIASIPMGAQAINRDIRSQSIPEKHVEKLKCAYGSAVADLAPEDKMLRISGRTTRENKDILLHNLATVIEARATDIAEFVQAELRESGYAEKLGYGVVLTGGSAALKDLDELFRRVIGGEVRVGVPEQGIASASLPQVASPSTATVVGLLLKAAGVESCLVPETLPVTAPAPAHAPAVAASPAAKPQDRWAAPPAGSTRPVVPNTIPPAPKPKAAPPEPEPDPEPVMDGPSDRPAKRSWFKKLANKVNDGFNASDDEEI